MYCELVTPWLVVKNLTSNVLVTSTTVLMTFLCVHIPQEALTEFLNQTWASIFYVTDERITFIYRTIVDVYGKLTKVVNARKIVLLFNPAVYCTCIVLQNGPSRAASLPLDLIYIYMYQRQRMMWAFYGNENMLHARNYCTKDFSWLCNEKF